MQFRILLFLFCIPIVGITQTFTDVTPGGIPALDLADVAWADYNNDGYLDFALMGDSGSGYFVGVYTGLGDGTFQLLPGDMPRIRQGDIDCGDFDNDGDPDLAVIGRTDESPWDVTVILRNNITSFEKYFTTYGSLGGSLMWFDYDNDRDLDLYQVGSFFNNYYPNSVFINTNGQFSTDNAFHVKGYYSELAIDFTSCIPTDFDQDGDQDIFSTGEYSYGVWNEASLLTNKGVKDIENTSTYRFSYHNIAIRNGSVNQGDFNKDGHMDYFLTGNSSSISNQDTPFSQVLFGTGDGNFAQRGGLLDVYNSSSDIGDFDNDGDLDIIVSGKTSGGSLTKIYKNDGSGSFTDTGITNLAGLSDCSVTFADYDNDGDLDIFMIGRDQANARTTKLYRNDLISKAQAPNEKPKPPVNLRVRMENNSVILEWDKASDKETPTASLTYNAYVSISPKTPFKLFPEAIVETGERKVYEHGNASINTSLKLKELLTGTYYFSVQSLDGANEGSEFAPEVSFKYTNIDVEGFTCPNSEQTISASSAPASYTWTISGGKILEGQGSETIRVLWDKQPINPLITATTSGSSNSFIPNVQSLPSAEIIGSTIVCNINNGAEYRPAVYSEYLSYYWTLDGAEFHYAFPSYEWVSTGNKLVTLKTTDINTSCTNSDTLHVIVSEAVVAKLSNDNGVYTASNTNPSYRYQWQQYVNSNWSTVSTEKSFRPSLVGQYRLVVTNQYECSDTRFFFVDDIITGLEDQDEEFQLVPNPASTSFKIKNLPHAGRRVNIAICDMAGQQKVTTSTLDDTVEINCSTWSKGLYIVSTEVQGKIKYSKIIVK